MLHFTFNHDGQLNCVVCQRVEGDELDALELFRLEFFNDKRLDLVDVLSVAQVKSGGLE